MLCIERNNTDPYFNLAAEEYILKGFGVDVFMLWHNDPCIVVGKHQNTLAEINVEFVREQNLPVVRRISGGGTVFHDHGNLNFTFIRNGEKDKLVNFRRFTQPIIDVLETLGITATFGGRNDLTFEGKKFSGNAEHVYKNRVLHHGTILFNSNLDHLEQSILTQPSNFSDKAVKSVRSTVTNIQHYLANMIEMDEFKELVQKYLLKVFPGSEIYKFTDDDVKAIHDLSVSKYQTWQWNFGYSPRYSFNRTIKTGVGNIEFYVMVKNGIILDIKIKGFNDDYSKLSEIELLLINQPHNPEAIEKILNSKSVGHFIKNIPPGELIKGMF